MNHSNATSPSAHVLFPLLKCHCVRDF